MEVLITKLVISYIYSNFNRLNQRSSGDEDIGLCGSRGDAPSIQGALPQVRHEDAPPLEAGHGLGQKVIIFRH